MAAQVEGRQPVLESLRAGRGIHEILLAAGTGGAPVTEIRRLAAERGVPVREVPRSELDGRAATDAPQGVIASVVEFRYTDLDDLLDAALSGGETPLVVAFDGITDPGNAGALARTCEAVGAHGLILPRSRSVSVTPSMEKAAAGALAYLPVARVPNLARSLEALKTRGTWIVALDGDGEASLWELELATEPLCLVVGAEGRGVSRLVADRADVRCRIPTVGRVGSLNASVAGAVALFEVARRRRNRT